MSTMTYGEVSFLKLQNGREEELNYIIVKALFNYKWPILSYSKPENGPDKLYPSLKGS